jgi:hypothetical protein
MPAKWSGRPSVNIKKAMYDHIAKKAKPLEAEFTDGVKKAVAQLDVKDTGLLQSKTTAKIYVSPLLQAVIIRFEVEKAFYENNASTILTAILAIKGEGTHRSKGKRNFLRLGAAYALNSLGIKSARGISKKLINSAKF